MISNTSKYACPMCKNPNYQDLGNDNFGCPECGYAWSMPTLFDRITASPEVLAEKLVYRSNCKMIHQNDKRTIEYWTFSWKSSVIKGQSFETREEAIAATVAKLKEVCDAEKN